MFLVYVKFKNSEMFCRVSAGDRVSCQGLLKVKNMTKVSKNCKIYYKTRQLGFSIPKWS